MPTSERLRKAVAAAAQYAPKPQASTMLYGFIAVAVLGIGLTVFGEFYGVDVLAFPVPLAVGGAAAFVFGAVLRGRRARAHGVAVDNEFDRDR